MKLIMTMLVRDEEDVLRANIEFHLAQGVDFYRKQSMTARQIERGLRRGELVSDRRLSDYLAEPDITGRRAAHQQDVSAASG